MKLPSTESSRVMDCQTERLAFLSEVFPQAVHEVNNCLQPMIWFCEVELDRVVCEEKRAGLERILTSAQQAGRLTGAMLRVLDFTETSEAGDVDLAVQNACELFGRRLRGPSGCHFVWEEVEGGLPAVGLSTSNLELVIANLLKNALDSTECLSELSIRGSARHTQDSVVIRIWNSGSKIPPQDIEKIFEAFYTTKPAGKGTGLGLSVCRRLVTSAGGTISAANQEGGGVSFMIELPAKIGKVDKLPASPRKRGLLEGRSILLVDDDESVLSVMSQIVAHLGGADVSACSDGEEAIRLLETETFDAMILDLRMPGLSGQDVYRRLNDGMKKKTIFLTGDTVDVASGGFLAETGRPILTKPVTIDEMLETVRTVVHSEADGVAER